jgi:hypothetical protein
MTRSLNRLAILLLFVAAPAFAQTGGGAAPAAKSAATATAPSATPSATTPATTPAATGAATATPAAPVNAAGTIDLIEGDVRVFDSNRTRRDGLKTGDTMNEGDAIITGADSELHLNMKDGGYLAVRPNTTMKITRYQANGNDDDRSVFGLLKGTLRSVTGFIGKINPKSYAIYTPTATIGVRGTDHETYVIDVNDPAGEAGTYDKVNNGGTFIETPQGRTEVTPNHAGFAPHAGGAPHVLAKVPVFFKPTKNEGLINKRIEARPPLQQLRQQRQQQFQERSGQKTAPGAAGARPAAKSEATKENAARPTALKPGAAAENPAKQNAAKENAAKENEARPRPAPASEKASFKGDTKGGATPASGPQTLREKMQAQREKMQAQRQQNAGDLQKQRQEKVDAFKKAQQERQQNQKGKRKTREELEEERKRRKE